MQDVLSRLIRKRLECQRRLHDLRKILQEAHKIDDAGGMARTPSQQYRRDLFIMKDRASPSPAWQVRNYGLFHQLVRRLSEEKRSYNRRIQQIVRQRADPETSLPALFEVLYSPKGVSSPYVKNKIRNLIKTTFRDTEENKEARLAFLLSVYRTNHALAARAPSPIVSRAQWVDGLTVPEIRSLLEEVRAFPREPSWTRLCAKPKSQK